MSIIHGDCLTELKKLPDASVDSVVTDPPYGLSFMGKKWDHSVPSVDVWRECLRVLKPDGHMLVACGTRTQHRMVINIEDAGFEIRDVVTWLYGSGFPKSHNLDGDHKGWGTALKPACEFWTLARKPLEGTVAANVRVHGTGALNIDGCRLETKGKRVGCITPSDKPTGTGASLSGSSRLRTMEWDQKNQGRWPANLILDEVAAEMLDEQSGTLKSGKLQGNYSSMGYHGGATGHEKNYAPDSGGASRFFYVAKASKAERNAGLGDLPEREVRRHGDTGPSANAKPSGQGPVLERNHHPTVKPIKLMRFLCRLITPPGGTVLDPFMGSGSTGVGALKESFRFVGIERELDYIAIARARLKEAGLTGHKKQRERQCNA